MTQLIAVFAALLMVSVLEMQRYLGVGIEYVILSVWPLGQLGMLIVIRLENRKL